MRPWVHAILTLVGFAAGGSVHAVDVPVVGKSILLVTSPTNPGKNRLVLRLAGGAPASFCPNTYELSVSSASTGESFTIPLDCAKWEPGRSQDESYWIYRDRTGATCQKVVISGSFITPIDKAVAVCRGPQVAYDLGADQQAIVAELRFNGGARRACATFSDANGCTVRQNGSNGMVYAARGCETVSPCPASPAGAFLEAENPSPLL